MTNKKVCTCDQQLYHSSVTDVRFRWNKTYARYTKYRHRVCNECRGHFATIEINRTEFKSLIDQSIEFKKIKARSKDFMKKIEKTDPTQKFNNLINSL